jgi:hypothetical protein
MIGPSKINNGGITFTGFAHTNREYGSTLAHDCGFPHSFFSHFSHTVWKTVAAAAGVFRSKVTRRHALENLYGDVVRNLKG